MTHAAEEKHWASLEVPSHGGQVQYAHGDIHQLSRRRASSGVYLRVIAEAQALTKPVIAELDGVAEKILHQAAHASARRVIEGYWEKNTSVMDFVYERGKQLRPVAPSEFAEVVEAWTKLFHRAGAQLGPPYIIQLERAGSMGSLAQVWDDLARTIDTAMEFPATARHNSASVAAPADPADARRTTLLALNWPTSIEVGRRAGSTSRNVAQWAKDKRDAGQLLGAWSSSERTYRHPGFQFNDDGSLRPEVRDLLATLAGNPAWSNISDANGWRRTYWLYQPFRSLNRRTMAFCPNVLHAVNDNPNDAAAVLDSYLLDDAPENRVARTPADVFAENPQAVIAFARAEVASALSHTEVPPVPHD
ncbi:hypothetical protein [Pinirhizobacter sp.]|jgi:hypothetical protein|uniref:hypothetical protein n=1 Tax=Pinirhizobacter sp. TaxID=2950432 RepID=UPI002F3F51FD